MPFFDLFVLDSNGAEIGIDIRYQLINNIFLLVRVFLIRLSHLLFEFEEISSFELSWEFSLGRWCVDVGLNSVFSEKTGYFLVEVSL
jgi:hypothetical protein